MLFKGLLGVELSGALGGVVASHNKGGTYFRERVVPTNPNSTFQQAVRNAVSQLSSMWQNTLTVLQRARWQNYADNVTVPNRLGDQVQISAMAHFVRSNVTRIQIGQAIVVIGPIVFNLGEYTAPTLSNFSEAAQAGDVNFTTVIGTDGWANEVGGFMAVFISPPQNSNIQYYRGPYRVAFSIAGDPVPPASPSTAGVPFPIVAGQRIFGRAVTMRADGRYSASSTFTVLAVA